MAGVEILLVSGLHANEACAPLMAREVGRQLRRSGVPVALYHVPYQHTLLALLDDPIVAVTDHSMPAGRNRLDMDLEGLDAELKVRFPDALTFEFHNSEDTLPILGIDPGKPVDTYEVGEVGPRFIRPFEIGTWRDVGPDGIPGKYLIEMPAVYVPVDRDRRSRRRSRVAWLRARGYEFDDRWEHYLDCEANLEASRRRGYLEDCLACKVAGWIFSRSEEVG